MRAYSMANYPEEKGLIILNVRIALPPFGKENLPPGKMSSYIFSLKKGDEINILGPFGDFFAKETEREMVFIGGGAGMAPMRSHILDQLLRIKTKRKISFWYGARSKKEMFYIKDFQNLSESHENFSWNVALSEPDPEDNWEGSTGYIHDILYDLFLKSHEDPKRIEYYICGPPPMMRAVFNLLDQLNVPKEQIMADDFGS